MTNKQRTTVTIFSEHTQKEKNWTTPISEQRFEYDNKYFPSQADDAYFYRAHNGDFVIFELVEYEPQPVTCECGASTNSLCSLCEVVR